MNAKETTENVSLLELETVPLGASKVAIATSRLSRLIRTEQEKALATHGDLTLVEWRICMALSQEKSVSQKGLIAFTQIQQAQVSRALVQLEAREIIKSLTSETDRRSKLYTLTDLGHEHFKRNLPVITAFSESIEQALGAAEVALFLDLSERIAKAAKALGSEK